MGKMIRKFKIWFKYDFMWWMENEGGCQWVAAILTVAANILSAIAIIKHK